MERKRKQDHVLLPEQFASGLICLQAGSASVLAYRAAPGSCLFSLVLDKFLEALQVAARACRDCAQGVAESLQEASGAVIHLQHDARL